VDRYGGTFLGTSRTNPFDPKNDRSKVAADNVKKLSLNSLIAIGGDDISVQLSTGKIRRNVVGIPKTIDKDLPETDYSLGFETALNSSLKKSIGSYHRRFTPPVFIIEIMGRTAGWLALEGGEAAGTDMILILSMTSR